ncbi:hypothetical protein [Azospirillum formosense]|uniref:hypothetical protein n=1 Tax=Azospirillum formosense TaxID=861533 RepID=UPI00338E9039
MAPAAFRCPAKGTTITFQDGRTATALDRHDDTCVYAVGTTTETRIYSMSRTDQPRAERFRQAMAKLWPLEVNKQAVADHDLILTGDDDIDKKFSTEIEETITVLRSERLTTPAGTFDTYVIERAYKMLLRRTHGRYLLWYDPNTGIVLKGVLEHAVGVRPRTPDFVVAHIGTSEISKAE